MPKTISDAEYRALVQKSKTGWARYYERLQEEQAHAIHMRAALHAFRQKVEQPESTVPKHLRDEFIEMATALGRTFECCICMTTPTGADVEITRCGHRFCKTCFNKLKETTKECALCRKKLY
jgi:hypothetical protein